MKILTVLLLTGYFFFCWSNILFAANDNMGSSFSGSKAEGHDNTLSTIYKQREEAENERWQLLLEQQQKEQQQREEKRQQINRKQLQREQQWKLIERQQIEQQRIKLDWLQPELK
jgi:hypothetical protein